MTGDWPELNLANWEARVPLHVSPGGYDLDSFDDHAYLSGVVRYDLPRLGDITSLDVVHLQCHIGTDTVSLARLGPRSVTGLDFSPWAIAAATSLATRAAAQVSFVESDVYDAPTVLGAGSCDLVYTGIGAVCWLPDIRRWATVIADLLRPGGRFFVREGHPMLDTLSDTRSDDLLVVHYRTSRRREPRSPRRAPIAVRDRCWHRGECHSTTGSARSSPLSPLRG